MQKSDPYNVLLIDCLNSLFYLKHCRESDPVWKFTNDIKNIVRDWKIHKVILCCDSGQSSYRLSMYPQYKETRRANREKASEAEKEDLARFFKHVEQFIKMAPMYGFEVAAIKGVEADDIISYFSTGTDDGTYRVATLSSDGDLLQLLRPGVIQRSYGPKMKLLETDIPQQVWVNHRRFEDVYQITPQQFMEYKALAGDTGDSIYSPEGMGTGTALKLIRKYGSLANIEANLNELDVPRFPEKTKAALIKNFDMVKRNVDLVNLLHDDATYKTIFGEGISLLEDIKARIPESPVVDEKGIKEYLFETGRVNIYNSFDSWVKPLKGAAK